MSDSLDDVYTPKHKRLLWFASVARIIAWITLVAYIMAALSITVGIYKQEILFNYPVTNNPIQVFDQIMKIMTMVLVGVAYWFFLQGLALGLSMLVETDMNYRITAQGENNE